MKGPYPEIQGGGSLILAWQIRNKRVLVVGGGEVRLHPQAPYKVLTVDKSLGRRWSHSQRAQCRRQNHRRLSA